MPDINPLDPRDPRAAHVVGGDGETPDAQPIPRDPAEWDSLFREDEAGYFFGREPSTLARTAYQYWKLAMGNERGELLDLGCGEGRDAVFYAEKGFDILAVDGSEAALNKTARLAHESSIHLSVLQRDIRTYTVPHDYKFIHANNCLQFLGKDCLSYLAYLRRRTLPGGFHAVSVFTGEQVPEQEGIYRFYHNELKEIYKDWKVRFYAEQLVWRQPVEGFLSFAQIIAQRP